MELWDNIQALRSLSHSLIWVAVILPILGAVGLRYYIDRRIGDLSAAAQTAREAKLRADIDSARQQQEAAEAKVGELQATLAVQFSGDWSEEPYPLSMLSLVDQEFYVYFKRGQGPNAHVIKLHATGSYQFTTISPSRAKFVARQGVRPGEFPIGRSREALSEFDTIGFHIPFLQLSDFCSPRITVEDLRLVLILNGASGEPLRLQSPMVVPIRTYPSGARPWASFELPVRALDRLPK
jgi:hypothetical protein